MSSRASIVVPAHNEERRIRSLLETLSAGAMANDFDVYVVCNGCTDRTRDVAEEYPGITVVEIADVGKYHALNEGDRLAGDAFPRLYCDADVHITRDDLSHLIETLITDEVLVAGPTVRYGVEESSWWIRMYYSALESPIMAPWLGQHLTGRGLFGASREARRRFESFPPLYADDLFFDSQFDAIDKVIVTQSNLTIWVPKTLRELLRGELRVARGNCDFRMAAAGSLVPNSSRTGQSGPTLRRRLRTIKKWLRELRTQDLVPLAVYVTVITTVRVLLMTSKLRGNKVRWR
jgi:glycosyltransferase involved in cell wall biosynthesis